MHRAPLLQLLDYYQRRMAWPEEAATVNRMIDFVQAHSDCFERSLLIGHITGSSMVCSRDFSSVILTHHKKLNKWLQLGGHADGCADVFAVSLREAREESGIDLIDVVNLTADRSVVPFDVDIHVIPKHKEVPEHEHFDVRFLLCVDRFQKVIQSEESNDLRWFTLEEAQTLTDEPSMLRQFEKIKAWRKNL